MAERKRHWYVLPSPFYFYHVDVGADRMTAIWDNRSVFHTATFDYAGQGERFGNRAVGLGERPYLDPNSTSRRTALANAAQ